MEFPCSRFPGFFHEGFINREAPKVNSVLGWGEHGGVLESPRDPDKDYGQFIPLYSRKREEWAPTDYVPSPLLPPNSDCCFAPVAESDLVYKKEKFARHTKQKVAGVTLAFSKQISRFCWDHGTIAFQCMGRLLEPHCYVGDYRLQGKIRAHSHRMTSLMQSLKTVPYQDCAFAHSSYFVRSFSYFTRDWLQDVPPELLAELVNEGMAEEWTKLQFQASLTGGALSWASYPGTSYGCLIYPRGAAMNRLYFQQLLLDQSDGLGVKLQGDPAVYDLTERIQQVSVGDHEQMSVGVRTSFHLASWSFSADNPPKPLSVLSTRTPSTCISASPHIEAEFCVCTESGTLYLWSVESGLQRIRQDADTLLFRDDPHWRWSDFTSHPRVLTYADRTAVQFADIRVPNSQGLDLFHIGQESLCRKGERVTLMRGLRETNPAHCMVTTQFSLYMMDERFPLVPLAKWDHMLQGSPTYVSIIPGGASNHSNKMLLGNQNSQETLVVQYSDGPSGSCQLHLPSLSLLRISESLHHLAPLLPHHHNVVLPRLQSPLAGIAACSPKRTGDHLLVFQLTAAGDLFFQRLSQKVSDGPSDSCGITVESTVSNSAPEEPAADHPHQSAPEEPVADQPHQSASEDEVVTRCRRSNDQHSVAQSPGSSNSDFCIWLHDLYEACPWKEAVRRPQCQIHTLFPSDKMSGSSPDVVKLRERLRETMKRGALVPSAAAPTSHRLETVRPESWRDPISQRLTASWEGRLGLWWDDRLGRNKESKIQALREKRRRQKLLRSHSLSPLTRSFTASIASDPYETDSPWSCDSAPEDVSSMPSTSQEWVADASQATVTSTLSQNSFAFTSSQSLQAKGIPHERRQTLRDFFSFIGDETSAASGPEPSLSQTLSQPSSKRSRMGF